MSTTLRFAPVLLAGMAAFSSCSNKKDDPTPIVVNESTAPVVNQQNLYPTPSVKLGFSVQVLPSSVASARIEGLSAAIVTVKQNGKEYTTTTDQTGVATFAGLTEGEVNVFVKKDGFLSVNKITSISYNGSMTLSGTSGNSTGSSSVTVNNEQYSASQFPVVLPKLGSKLEAIVRADVDGNGTGSIALLASGDVQLVLNDKTFEPNVFPAKVSNGTLVIENLPEGVAFKLQTINVFATNPSFGTTPSFKTNLNFDGTNRTTLGVGNTLQLGIVDLD